LLLWPERGLSEQRLLLPSLMTFSSIPGTKVEGEYQLLASCPLISAYAHKHKYTHVHRDKGINVIVSF
ncbi:hypothetical protein ACQP3J_30555, partial [Escherichia coli]